MLFATSCFKNLVCANATDYFFSIYADLTPNTPTIHIGDTLWISITTPVTLKDNSSGENINFAGALNLSEGIGFEKIHGTDSISHAANDFHYYLIKGSPVKNPHVTQLREYKFQEKDNSYSSEIGIIPQSRGTFGIGLSGGANVSTKSHPCTRAAFSSSFRNIEHHFYLNPIIKGDTLSSQDAYYFQVQ